MTNREDSPRPTSKAHATPGQPRDNHESSPPLRAVLLPEPTAEARELLFSVHYWGERADLKATVLLATLGVIAVAEVEIFKEVTGWVSSGEGVRWLPFALLAASFASLIASGAYAAVSIYPRLGRPHSEPTTKLVLGDLTYFGRLQALSPDQIAEGLRSAIDEDSLVAHYAEQIQVNSILAWRKLRTLQHSLTALAVSVGLGILAAIAFGAIWLMD